MDKVYYKYKLSQVKKAHALRKWSYTEAHKSFFDLFHLYLKILPKKYHLLRFSNGYNLQKTLPLVVDDIIYIVYSFNETNKNLFINKLDPSVNPLKTKIFHDDTEDKYYYIVYFFKSSIFFKDQVSHSIRMEQWQICEHIESGKQGYALIELEDSVPIAMPGK